MTQSIRYISGQWVLDIIDSDLFPEGIRASLKYICYSLVDAEFIGNTQFEHYDFTPEDGWPMSQVNLVYGRTVPDSVSNLIRAIRDSPMPAKDEAILILRKFADLVTIELD